MEIVKKQVPNYKSVRDGTREETVYVAFDGKQFIRKDDALCYEAQLKFKDIQRFDSDLLESCDSWFKCKDEEELEFLKRYMGVYDSYTFVSVYGDIVPEKWFSARYIDGGDSQNEIIFTSLEYIKQQYHDLFEKLDNE